jgi:hypothetical protein
VDLDLGYFEEEEISWSKIFGGKEITQVDPKDPSQIKRISEKYRGKPRDIDTRNAEAEKGRDLYLEQQKDIYATKILPMDRGTARNIINPPSPLPSPPAPPRDRGIWVTVPKPCNPPSSQQHTWEKRGNNNVAI